MRKAQKIQPAGLKKKSVAAARKSSPSIPPHALPRPLAKFVDEYLAKMGFVRRGYEVFLDTSKKSAAQYAAEAGVDPTDASVDHLSMKMNEPCMSISEVWETQIVKQIIAEELSLWAIKDTPLSELVLCRPTHFLEEFRIVHWEKGILEFGQYGMKQVVYDVHIGHPKPKPPLGPPSKRRGRKPTEWDPLMDELILQLIGRNLPATNQKLVEALVDLGNGKPGTNSETSANTYIQTHWDFLSRACAGS